jgi:signal transduction histidine kinase
MKALPDPVSEIDAEGRYLFTSTNKPIGENVRDLLPEDVANKITEAVRKVIETGESAILSYSVPKKNGTLEHFQAHMGKSSNNTAVVITRDISESVEHQHKLQEVNQALTQFTSLVSHDLREPLTGIAGFATLLQKRYQSALDERGCHFLDRIVTVSQQMEKKLDDLLAFSKAGQERPFEPFPLGAAIEEAKRSLVRKIDTSKARIEVAGDMPLIHGDRSMVAQVIQNLFSNAIKYRRKNEPPHIKIEVEPYGPFLWKITVSDNGIGFDMQHKNKIFGVFQRLYTIEQYPGTGIGLAIARRVIEQHGGKIWPWSKPGVGTKFHFTLPRVENGHTPG